MIIQFRCERDHARRWMCRETLPVSGQDIPVQIAWTAATEARPSGLEALFVLERMVLRKGKAGAADQIKVTPERSQARLDNAHVVVDFTTAARDPQCSAKLYLRPKFN